jgi:hypothetical protein
VVAKPLEVVEILSDFGQFEAALDTCFDAEVGLGLRGVGVGLLVGVDHPIVGNAKAIDVSGDSPVI